MGQAVQWLKAYKLWIDLAADILTFAGGLLLARDAFCHLKDLRQSQLEAAFRLRFPRVSAKMQDPKFAEAKEAGRWAARGMVLLAVGFLCQIAGRFAE